MLRLLTLAALLAPATAQPSHLEAVAATVTETIPFLVATGADGHEAFVDAARSTYVKAALGTAPPRAALEADALALGILTADPLADGADPDLWTLHLGMLSPEIRLADSLAVRRYVHASGLLDRLVRVLRLEAESPANPHRVAMPPILVNAHREGLWLQHQAVIRYALRDLAPSDLEAATAAHASPEGQAAVARSVEAVQALRPFVDALVAHSQYVLANLDKPIPPIEIPDSSKEPR